MFRETHNIPSIIKSTAPESEIRMWKKSPEVIRCYKQLFKTNSSSQPDTYMSKIIDTIWTDKKNVPKSHIAYAISVCEIILNPDNLVVSISEEAIKNILAKNLVSFRLHK